MNIVFMSMDTLPSTLWARDLYDQMHIRSDFRKWFPRMCQYGFIEGRDYEYILTNFISVRFKRPAVRRYEVENLYERELETAAPIQKKGGILGKK